MITLSEGPVLYENGKITETDQGQKANQQKTIAYQILKAHNTAPTMDKLQVRFDKLTSHDITYVGIIQTARASGLERFPMPYIDLSSEAIIWRQENLRSVWQRISLITPRL